MNFLSSNFFLAACILSKVEYSESDLCCWSGVQNETLAVNECFQNITMVMKKKNSRILIFTTYMICSFLCWLQEFIINTPDFEAAKFWVGNMGKHATHAVVYAQLYTPDGQCQGLHSFIVQVG